MFRTQQKTGKRQQQQEENSHLFLCLFVYLPLGSKKQNTTKAKTEDRETKKKEIVNERIPQID